jgi:hypothetical protein
MSAVHLSVSLIYLTNSRSYKNNFHGILTILMVSIERLTKVDSLRVFRLPKGKIPDEARFASVIPIVFAKRL